MVLVQGENGQGKSNLLEAIYLLSIAKSARATADREMVRWQSGDEETYSRVAATIQQDGEPLRVQIDFKGIPSSNDAADDTEYSPDHRNGPESRQVQKYIRINGVPRRASDLVGQVNAVMFTANDLELVYGPPSLRRRYLDILISQVDRAYLRALQRYQRVVYQRNHLLKRVRERSSHIDELEFWDGELVAEGKYIIAHRLHAIQRLSELARPIHEELTGNGEIFALEYRPSVDIGSNETEEAIAEDFRREIVARRQKEIAQGVTIIGPHRDDLQLLIDGMDAGMYASRGQSRTAVLAMKLAEVRYMMTQRRQEPILLLDDVLSELDAVRRAHVLDRIGEYQQCFITTADVDSIEDRFLSRMSRFVVQRGRIEPVELTANADTT